MSWREPEALIAAGLNEGVRISARKTGGPSGISVYVTIGRPVMQRLGWTREDRVRVRIGHDEHRGWIALDRPAPSTSKLLKKIGSVGGAGRRDTTASRLQFTAKWLAGVAAAAPLSATDCDHMLEAGILQVRLPDAWLSESPAARQPAFAPVDMDDAAAIEQRRAFLRAVSDPDAEVIVPPAEAVPATADVCTEPAETLAEDPVPDDATEDAPGDEADAEYSRNNSAAVEAPAEPAAKPVALAKAPEPPPPWSDAELAELRRLWKLGASNTHLESAFPGRTLASIRSKASVLKLGFRPIVDQRGPDEATPKRPQTPLAAPAAPVWTSTKREKLRRMWKEGADDDQLAAAFPEHTIGAVRDKANSLGLGARWQETNRAPRVATYAPKTAGKPVTRVATVAPASPVIEERRLPARRPAGEIEPPAELDLGLSEAMAAPIAFLRDAGMKVAESPIARGTWFVDGEAMTARQIVQQANTLCRLGGMPERFRFEDRTDRIMSSGGGSAGSSLTNLGAG